MRKLNRRELIKMFGMIGVATIPILRQSRAFAEDFSSIYIQLFKPNGNPENSYYPKGDLNSLDYTGQVNESFNAFKDYVIAPKKLALYTSGGNAHTEGICRNFTNGTSPEEHNATKMEAPNAPSIDHIIADYLYNRRQTPLKHFHFYYNYYGFRNPNFLAYDQKTTDTCSFLYKQAYYPVNNIVDMYDKVFQPLQALCDSGAQQPFSAQQKQQIAKKSILDFNLDKIASIKNRLDLSVTEAAKLDDYTEQLRMLENNLSVVVNTDNRSCPSGIPRDNKLEGDQRSKAIMDIMLLAIEWELTNVASFQFDSAQGFSKYNHLDLAIRDNHHSLSHDNSSGGNSSFREVSRWQWSQLAYLLNELKNRQTINGTNLLDRHLALVSGGEIAYTRDPNHWHIDMPFVLVGKANGAIAKTGYTFNTIQSASNDGYTANKENSHARLLLSVCHAMGLTHLDYVGDQDKCQGGPLI